VEPAGAADMRARALAILLAATCVVLTGCGRREEVTTPQSPQKLTILVDFPPAGKAALYAAQKEGYLRAAGIDAKIQVARNDGAAIQAVAGGHADVAAVSEPALLQARDRGLRVVSIGGLVRGPLAAVVASGKLSGARDLSGKRVGLADSPYAAAFAKTIGARNGSPLKTSNASTNPAQALAKHKVDALLGIYLDDPRLPRKKVSVATVDRFGIPTYDELVLVANEDALSRNGDLYRSLNGALQRATADLRHGKPVGAVPAGQDAVKAVLSRLGSQQNAAQWKAFAEWMQANGLLKGQPNAAAAFTNKYMPGKGT